MPKKRLFWQLYPSFLLATACCLVAVGWYASRSMRSAYFRQTAADLEGRAYLLEDEVRERLRSNDSRSLDDLCKRLGQKAALRITVISESGQVIGDSHEKPVVMDNHASRPEVAEALSGRIGTATRYSATLKEDMMYVALPIKDDGRTVAVVRTSLPMTHVGQLLNSFYVLMTLGWLAIAALAVVLILLAYRRVRRPLEDIRLGAERLARGELDAKLPIPDSEELGRLAEALNQMAERLRKLENVRREFVANVSHELKTPITSIKGFIETLQDGAVRNPEEAQEFLGIVAKHADRLNCIIEDLLVLARIEQDAEKTTLDLSEVPLRDVLRSAIEDCTAKASAKNISVYLLCASELRVRVSAPLMEQAVVNLIDNAIKYSAPSAPVRVEASVSGAGVVVCVRDQGCGIDADHLPRLGERFYRVDKARSRQQGGTGLGLAIVKHIAQMHGGGLSVESMPGKGSTFSIHLPMSGLESQPLDRAQKNQ